MMSQILEKNNIPLPNGARKEEGGLNFQNKDRFHALVTASSESSSIIMDSCSSRNMDSIQVSFSILHTYSGPSILMGDDSEIPAKGIGRINLDNGYFNNVLYVHDIETNILQFYQMTHTCSYKRVTCTQYGVEIS